MAHVKSLWIVLAACLSAGLGQRQPCVEINRELQVPCECAVVLSGLNRSTLSLEVNCDRVSLTEEAWASLAGQPISAFSQRRVGHQAIPAHLVAVLPERLERLDLSGNAIHKLMSRQLQGREALRELRLADNALGDNLNPIFSSNEFRELRSLRLLDLRGNGLRSIEEGIFNGCDNLEELYLDFNNIKNVPINSLKGPKAIRVLSLAGNNIGSVHRGALWALGENLLRLDLSSNGLSYLDDGAFDGMSNLLILNISFNDLHRLNSDVFKGAYSLQQLDLSSNFLEEFPTEVLRHQKDLKFLNVSNNLITELERTHLTNFKELQILDLSRNGIGRLGLNTFTDLASLIRLDLSLNALRTIEESSFEGLTSLKWLSLQDNNILLVPSSALARLPALTHLYLEYNRIAALSSEILRASAPRLMSLSLTRNLVRELAPRLFEHFERLVRLELAGNMVASLDRESLLGLEETLLHLDLSGNRLRELLELPLRNLVHLNAAGNQIRRVAADAFKNLHQLRYLNLSDNPLYGGFPPLFPRSLLALDVARTGLEVLPGVLLLSLENLRRVSFSGNRLHEISEGTFKRLLNLSSIDLSYNAIERIDNAAFVGLRSLHSLNLRGNRLRSFGGEHFNTGTGLEILDLSHNRLEYLSPTSFLIHPRLRQIDLSANRFTVIYSEALKNLQFLEILDLSQNQLQSVGEFAFAQISRLRELNLSRNRIETVGELAFHNSSQLQRLDLGRNRLESLSERTMEGVLRIERMDLSENGLNSLPDTIFEPSRLRSLERLDLSGNRFLEIPTRALLRQSEHLVELRIARNRLSEIFTQEVVAQVKSLDLSGNPLSRAAVGGIFSEAKVLRELSLAGCGLRELARLEAPYLRRLNLSGNAIASIEPLALQRTTMLEELDLSRNRLPHFQTLLKAFGSPPALRLLDASRNDVRIVNESSFLGLEGLRELAMHGLENCSRIEKSAFKPLSKLRRLAAHGYPRLGYFDVQGILRDMNGLEAVDIEIKDINAGNEQLSVRMHPRLKSLVLRGERLRNVLSSLLVGVRASRLILGLRDTSVDSVPATLLFPVPRSTEIELDVTGSPFGTISPQLISVFEERAGALRFKGFNISVKCDCQAKPLWKLTRALRSRADNSIVCEAPEHLLRKSLVDVPEEQLSCEATRSTPAGAARPEHTEPTAYSTKRPTSAEPEIIWTVAPTIQEPAMKHPSGDSTMTSSAGVGGSTEDTFIIGIVGGVVALIAIVVIAICICRLRWSSHMNEARMQAALASSMHDATMLRPASNYSGKLNQELYAVGSYNGSTLGHPSSPSQAASPVHMLPLVQPLSLVQPQPIYGYYDGSQAPIYITAPSENKFDR